MSNRTDPIKLIAGLAAGLVGLLALLAFILSYNSLQHLAASNGIPGWLSHLWPLLLDFAMIVFSLAILRANLRREPNRYPWLLTIAFASLATVANVLDVASLGLPPVVIAAAVKALAPVALVLAFELLMSMLKAEINRAAVVTSLADLQTQTDQMTRLTETLATQIEQQQVKLTDLRDQAKQLSAGPNRANVEEMNRARSTQMTQRREQVLTLADQGMTRPEIANELGVSVTTIKRDLKALNGRVRQ